MLLCKQVISKTNLDDELYYRVFSQFTLEIILAASFGYQAEILSRKAENDELYKAAQAVIDLFSEGSAVSLYGPL